MKIYNINNTRKIKHQGFVLPTVLVLSIVLLTLGLSVFQLTSTIARSLTDQYWQKVSKQATQAGASYMSACVDQGLSGSTWPASITQNDTCLGVPLSTPQPSIFTNTTDTNPVPNPYRSSFTIYKPTVGADGIPKARIVGTVSILNTAGTTTIKAYTTEMVGIINGPTSGFEQISSGSSSSCGLTDGRLYCWGDGLFGQLGNNGTAISTVPVPVKADAAGDLLYGKVITFASGGMFHKCAVAGGRGYCWGRNQSGELGNNSTTNSLVPVAVDTSAALSGKYMKSISAGDSGTCAVASGSVYCWGHGGDGTNGNNSISSSSVPVAVDTSGVLNGKVVTQVSRGSSACALADSQAYCWGYNFHGNLGNNLTTNSSIPVAVDTSGVLNGKIVTDLSVGSNTCVVASGQAFCWGRNNVGQNGDNSTNSSSIPVAVDTSGVLNGKIVTKISSYGNYANAHACAIANSQAFCWGDNDYGQLGNNSTNDSLVPVAVSTSGLLNGRAVTDISVGDRHTCVVAEGKLFCWGHGFNGKLGHSKTSSSNVPVRVYDALFN